jgi:UTP:GlnB (protein PII) uridylyltransferase
VVLTDEYQAQYAAPALEAVERALAKQDQWELQVTRVRLLDAVGKSEVATNAVGLLYRISRVIASHQCDVALVLIATEGEKAIDVFHLTRGGAKLTEAEQLALTADLQRTLEESR